MLSQEEIESQQNRLTIHRQTLSVYLTRLATVGATNTTPEVFHGIREARVAIKSIKDTLRTCKIPVDDHPDDEELIQERFTKPETSIHIKHRVRIYLQGDFSLLSSDRRAAAVESFAVIMGIPPEEIEIYRIYEGSIIFELGVPAEAFHKLRSLLQNNDAVLHRLGITRITLEEADTAQEWVADEGIFETNTLASSDINRKAQFTSQGNRLSKMPQSGLVEPSSLISHDILLKTRSLIDKFGWSLLSDEKLAKLAQNSIASEGLKQSVEQVIITSYTIAWYEACRQYDDTALREVGYTELFRFLYRRAYNRWPDIAEDVAQQALLLIYEQIDRVKVPATFRAFALYKLLESGKRARQSHTRESSSTPNIQDNLPDAEPITLVLQQENLTRLLDAINRLPAEQKQAIMLRYFVGFTDRAIAEQLSTTIDNVTLSLKQGLSKLRKDERLLAYLNKLMPEPS